MMLYLGLSKLSLILNPWIGEVSVQYVTVFIPSMILFLTLKLRQFKRCRNVAILLASVICLNAGYDNVLALIALLKAIFPKTHYFHFMTSFIKLNWIFLIGLLLPLILGIFAFRYLWVKENFRNLFKIKRLRIFNFGKKMRFTHWLKSEEKWIIFCVNTFKKLLLLWPIGVISAIEFKPDYFLNLISNDLIRTVVLGIIPLVVLGLTLLFHWFRVGSVFSIILTSVWNVYVGCTNFYHFILSLIHSAPAKFDFQLIQYLAEAKLYWLAFYLLPLVATVRAGWYLWSNGDIRQDFSRRNFKKSKNFGTAKFADIKAIKALNHFEGLPIGAMPKVINPNDPYQTIQSIKKQGGGELIRLKAVHTTVVAPSGSGKGVGVVIPTLLEYPGPVFVTDIKGENYCVTQRARTAKGRKVIAFDPFEVTTFKKKKSGRGSSKKPHKTRINPLDFLDPKSKKIVDDTKTLASLICPTHAEDGTNASYFQSQGAAVIQCLLLYVVCSDQVNNAERNLSKVYDLLCMLERDLVELLKKIGEDKSLGYGSAANLANRIVSTDPRERSGILNSACVEMRFVDTPYVRESTECSDILLSEITKGNMDLFICIPAEKLETQSRLLRLLTGVVCLEMQMAQGHIGNYNLLMLIDEMPALGHMKIIEKMLIYGRGYGVSLMVISPTIELIQSVYPKTWKTFFSNQLSLFFGCTDAMCSEFVSEKLGKKTIETKSTNQGTSSQIKSMEFFGTSSNQSGDSLSETGRQLMMKEEIEKLGNKLVLAFFRDEDPFDPIMCQRIDYRERLEWKGMWDENPLHANRAFQNKLSFLQYLKEIYQALMN